MHIPRLATSAATICLTLAIPSLASAKDYCVGAPAGCTGTAVPAAGLAATLAEAAINGTDDRVLLCATTFDGGALSYNSLERLEVIGAGPGKTILRSSAAGPAFPLSGNRDSLIAELTTRVVAGANGGLELNGASGDRVSVEVAADAIVNTGVQLAAAHPWIHGCDSLRAWKREPPVRRCCSAPTACARPTSRPWPRAAASPCPRTPVSAWRSRDPRSSG